jgi:Mn2+/Fe2+ NRAMP family transporter
MRPPPAEREALERLDAAAWAERLPPPPRRRWGSALRFHFRGRSVRLHRLRRPRAGALRWLAILGPGLIASAAGNDAGGIATYSAAGARFGYDLLWVMVLLIPALGVVQETSARLGAATGRGLLDLVRERYGIAWALVVTAVILVANGGVVVTEFVGVAAAGELLGVTRWLTVPAAALLVWGLVVFGSYPKVEKVFLAMTLVFFAYPVTVAMVGPDWGEVARGAFVPTLRLDHAFLFVMVGLLGTTITPYMQLFEQSSIVDKGVARRHYGPEKVDAWVGSLFGNLMSIAMIVATAATLHAAGHFEITSAADAARALEPLAGEQARLLFAVGLLGASLLAGGVLPLATAYAVTEMLGAPRGVSLDPRRAPLFFHLFTGIVAAGAAAALLPRLPIIPLLLGLQVLNGALLPVVLFFILRLGADERRMGELRSTTLQRAVGWAAWGMVVAAVLVLAGGWVLARMR